MDEKSEGSDTSSAALRIKSFSTENFRSSRTALVQAVRNGDLTPKQAEAGLQAMMPSTSDVLAEAELTDINLHDVTTNSLWWLPLAVLFYAWRDLGRAREQWDRYQVWGPDLWRDEPDDRQVMTLDDAEKMLKSDLSQGILRAFGTNVESVVRPIASDAWQGLTIGRAQGFDALDADGMSVYSGAFVLRHEIVPLLISEHTGLTNVESEPALRDRGDQPAPKRNGGRVYAEHWHDMWAEVCRIVHDEGVPSDRLTIVKRMQQWFTDQGLEAPAPQKLNPIMDRLFKALKG